MKLVVTHITGIKCLYSFDAVSRANGTFGAKDERVNKTCTTLLNGASIVQYLELTPHQHNTFIDMIAGGKDVFNLVHSESGMDFEGLPTSVPPTMSTDSSAVVFEVGQHGTATVKLAGGSIGYEAKIEWTTTNPNISIIQLSNVSVKITGYVATTGTVKATLVGTDQEVVFNVRVEAIAPPNISAVGSTTISMNTGETANIEVSLSGGSENFVADVEYTSDNIGITVSKLSKTTARIDGVSACTGTVTATVKGTNKSVSYNVTVEDPVTPEP